MKLDRWESHALLFDLVGLHADSERLVRASAPRARRRVQFPAVAGGPEPEPPVLAGEVLELTLGAFASAHRQLSAHGVGLSKSEPLSMRMSGELAGLDPETGRAWVRLQPERKGGE